MYIYIYIYIYIYLCHKCKVSFVRQYNVSVSFPLKCVTQSTTSMNFTPALEADTTSGKTNIWKNFINNELR